MDLTDFIHTVEMIREQRTCLTPDDPSPNDIVECHKCPFYYLNYENVNVRRCHAIDDISNPTPLLKSWDEMITKKKIELI